MGLEVSRLCLGAGVRGELDEARYVRTVQQSAWPHACQHPSLDDRAQRVVSALKHPSAARRTTPARMAIAWLLDHPS